MNAVLGTTESWPPVAPSRPFTVSPEPLHPLWSLFCECSSGQRAVDGNDAATLLDQFGTTRLLAALDSLPDVLAAALPQEPFARVEARAQLAEFRAALTRQLWMAREARVAEDTERAHAQQRVLVHDSSNLLSAINGNLEFLERSGGLPQPLREALDDATDAGRGLQDLIARAGDLLALDHGRMAAPRWVRAEALVKAMRLPSSIALQAPPTGTLVNLRDAHVARVVRFLALRAQAAGAPSVEIRLEARALRITVQDDGPTPDEAVLRMMTTRAWRGEQAPAGRVDRSHGYHLACRVAELHGGTFSMAAATTGTGLRVELVLPQPEHAPT